MGDHLPYKDCFYPLYNTTKIADGSLTGVGARPPTGLKASFFCSLQRALTWIQRYGCCRPCRSVGVQVINAGWDLVTSLPQDPTADGSYSRSDSALAECNYPESKSDTVHSVYSVAR